MLGGLPWSIQVSQHAPGGRLEVHHGAAVSDLLCQAAGLQLDTLGGPTEGGERPALPWSVHLALGGGKAAAPEISQNISRDESLERLDFQFNCHGGGHN